MTTAGCVMRGKGSSGRTGGGAPPLRGTPLLLGGEVVARLPPLREAPSGIDRWERPDNDAPPPAAVAVPEWTAAADAARWTAVAEWMAEWTALPRLLDAGGAERGFGE